MEQESATFSLDIFGIKSKYECNPSELEPARRIMESLQIKQNFRQVFTHDMLRTAGRSELGEKIEEGFNQVVRKNKREAIIGLAANVGLCALLKNYDLPEAFETVGYILAVAGGIANVINYARSQLAGMYVSYYLKDK